MDEVRYFIWDDDVAIPFITNDLGERVVDAAGLIRMAESCIWRITHGHQADRQTAAEAITTIREISANYVQATDQCVLPEWVSQLPIGDQYANEVEA